jgi:hypothetical protein
VRGVLKQVTTISRIFALFALAVLALPLCGSSAFGGTSAPAATADTNTTSADTSPPAPRIKWNNDVCEIIGVVDHLESVERSPWTDGTPSALSSFETDIWISVKDRKPHAKHPSNSSICNRGVKSESLAVYKLCSPTVVKKNDRIHAIEGLHTGSNKAIGCLFDVVVIPAAEASKK